MPQNKKTLCDLYSVGDIYYLLSHGPDIISAHLKKGKGWEEGTLYFSKMLIKGKPNPVLVDIGANLGAWSIPMAKAIKDTGGIVHAFEPQRPVYYQLCANLFTNDLMNCYAHNKAVGDFCGNIEIPLLDIHSCKNLGAMSIDEEIRAEQGWITEKNVETVEIVTLDSLSLPPADLVKIDVEGLELEVLTGGRSWLQASGNPPILFEVWGDYIKKTIAKRERIFSLLKDELGYECFMHGELCIAQHPQNKMLELSMSDNKLTVQQL